MLIALSGKCVQPKLAPYFSLLPFLKSSEYRVPTSVENMAKFLLPIFQVSWWRQGYRAEER